MDKKTIDNIITSIINKHLDNTVTKCSPKWLSKPTSQDEKFLKSFFDKNDIDSLNNYREVTDYDFEKDIKAQKDFHYEDDGFTDDEITAVEDWGDCGYEQINGKIYNTEHYRDMKKKGLLDEEDDNDIDKQIKTLTEAIEKSPNIDMDTILYRGGHWDDRIKVGDVVTQDGFASLSYDEGEASSFTDTKGRYFIEFYVPQGTKGLWLAEPFANLDESEYLIGQNIRYYVFDIDKDESTAKVVILP